MKIILFTSHCDRCKSLQKRLDEKHIQYEVGDLLDDEWAYQVAVDNKFKSAPMLQIGEKFLNFEEAMRWASEK